MEYTVENLEKAVDIFYNTEAQQQIEAHQWLNQAQASPQAWSFVWELLNPQKSFQVQYFAATTLHTKMTRHWAEVPPDQYDPLKQRILSAIVTYAQGPKIVLNRLCISLSAFIVHTVPNHWPKAFEELLSSFQPQHLPHIEPERVIWILLEILAEIPEELIKVDVILGQRNTARDAFQDVAIDIFKYIEMCLMPVPTQGFQMSNLTTYLGAARCVSTWIHAGGVTIQEISNLVELLIELPCFVYWNRVDVEGLSGDEIEVIEAAVEAITEILQHPYTLRLKNSVVKHAFSIVYKFDKILDVERTCNDLNNDIVASLYGLVVTLADTHSSIFINMLKNQDSIEQKMTLDMIKCILKCTDLPGSYPVDESASTLTFGFWYTLQEDILALSTAQCAALLLMVKPFYRELVCILLKKSLLPLSDDQWSLDDKEVFRCYRQDIADTFIYCYNVLNLEMLDILMSKLSEALTTDNNGNAGPETLKWNEIEACLHAFGAVAESIEMENLYLPRLMGTIKDIPFDVLHVKAKQTALDTVGSYSDWLLDHPDILGNVLPLIISSVGNPDVATSATMALKDITNGCQKYLKPYAESILLTSQTALYSSGLKLSERRRLMLSIGKVLSIMPVEGIMGYLNQILTPMFTEMQKAVNNEVSNQSVSMLTPRLKVLGGLFNSLYVEVPEEKPQPPVVQPIFLLMQSTMPLYKQIVEKYYNNKDVMVDLTALIKYGITNIKDECKPLVKDILEIVIRVYRELPQGNILVLAETVMILFGRDPEFCTTCQQLVYELGNITLVACANHEVSEMEEVLEGYFSMMAKTLKKAPHLVECSGLDMGAVFQCAILTLALPECQTVRAVTCFLVNFIIQSRDMIKAEVVQNLGEGLVLRLLLNFANMPRVSSEMLGDILLALNKKYCDNLARWLNGLLLQDNFPSPRVTTIHKQNFIKAILREKANKRKVTEAVGQFISICKGR